MAPKKESSDDEEEAGFGFDIDDNPTHTPADLNKAKQAIKKKDFVAIKKLFQEHPSLAQAQDKMERSLLHECVMMGGGPEMLKLLIQYGVDVNHGDECNQVPLHHAVLWGLSEETLLLLENGASILEHDISGWNSLHWCCFRGGSQVQQNSRDAGMYRRGAAKIKEGKTKCLLGLLDKKFNHGNIDQTLLKGWYGLSNFATPLHCAATFNLVECCQILLDHGADINAVDADGRYPIHTALLFDSPEAVHCLIQGLGEEGVFHQFNHTNESENNNEDDDDEPLQNYEQMMELAKKVHYTSEIDRYRSEGSKLSAQELRVVVERLWDELSEKERMEFFPTKSERPSLKEVVKKAPNTVPSILDSFHTVLWEHGDGRDDVQHSYTFVKNPKDMLKLLRKIVGRRLHVVVEHPVIQSILYLKWEKFGKWFFFAETIIRMMTQAAILVLIANQPKYTKFNTCESGEMCRHWKNANIIALFGILYIFVSTFLFFVYTKYSHWLSQPWKIIDTLFCMLMAAYFITLAQGDELTSIHFLSASNILAVFGLLEAIQQNATVGLYIRILRKMFVPIMSFVVMWLCFGVTLAFSMFGFLEYLSPSKTAGLEQFNTIQSSILVVTNALFGEALDMQSLFNASVWAGIVAVFYLIIGPILLVNLLIAAMNTHFMEVQEMAVHEWSISRAELIITYENNYRWLLRDKIRMYQGGQFLMTPQGKGKIKFNAKSLLNLEGKESHYVRRWILPLERPVNPDKKKF
eukprot:m.64699 g.64699  ORF g.64699 m.64699 type:complete len:748 (+) comp11667_c0_seq2:286-2529(+)